ncbi:MAG: DUF4838 domain-containing protein, partial [Clostridia bacterium]|nr:DUF4838 domain-containing protein [Clostridia bacterium]
AAQTEYATYDYTTGIDPEGEVFSIVSEGRVANYAILIPQSPSAVIVACSTELNDYIQKVSGTRLAVVKEDGQELPQRYISIGATNALQNTDIQTDTLKYDGFVIKTVGANVYIAARLDKGVQNGVYSFLERFLGIRWLTAKETYIPKNDSVKVQECNIVEEPRFQMRDWMGGDYANETFAAHRRYYRGDELFCNDYGSTHNTTDHPNNTKIGYVKKMDLDAETADGRTLGETHPEYFSDYTNAMEKGDYDLCFSNGITDQGTLAEGQSVASLMIKAMKNSLEKDKEAKAIEYFMVGHTDNRNCVCKCDTCVTRRANIKDSGIWVMFINVVEQHVNEWLSETQGRKIKIVIFAYQYTEVPPVEEKADGTYEPINELCRANDNVVIRIAPISADFTYTYLDPRQDKGTLKTFQGWSTVAKNVMVWDYVVNFDEYYWYFPTTEYLKINLNTFEDIGCVYAMLQSAWTQNSIWIDDIRNYITSKLFWNDAWNVEYLMNEYLSLFYGEAQDCVKSVIGLFESYYNELRLKDELEIAIFNGNGFLKADMNPIGWLNKIMRTVDDGMLSIENDDNISEDRKQALIYKLEEVKITPMRMILRNHTKSTEIEFAIAFFDLLEAHDVKRLGENSSQTVASRKAEWGLA